MLNVFVLLVSQLGESADRSGFALVDPADVADIARHDGGDRAAIQMLCYRHMHPGQQLTLLELCHVLERRLITATLWRPVDLTARTHVYSIDEVALHHQCWSYGQPTDADALANLIASEITCWLDRFASRTASPHPTDP